MAAIRSDLGSWTREQAHDGRLWFRCRAGISVVARFASVPFAMDLDRRAHRPGDCRAESCLGNTPRLAANHSGSQRAVIEKRAGRPATLPGRAGAVLFAHRPSAMAGRTRVASHCARRETVSLPWMGLPDRARGFHHRRRENLLPNGRLSDADGRRRCRLRTNLRESRLEDTSSWISRTDRFGWLVDASFRCPGAVSE